MTSIEVLELEQGLPFGARVRGVTSEVLDDPAVRHELTGLFHDRGVIVFEDVEPSSEMQVAISNVFGPLKEPGGHGHGHGHQPEGALPPDLSLREIGVLLPLAVLCVYIGFQPAKLTDTLAKPIDRILSAYPAQVENLHRTAEFKKPLQPDQSLTDLNLAAGGVVDG